MIIIILLYTKVLSSCNDVAHYIDVSIHFGFHCFSPKNLQMLAYCYHYGDIHSKHTINQFNNICFFNDGD